MSTPAAPSRSPWSGSTSWRPHLRDDARGDRPRSGSGPATSPQALAPVWQPCSRRRPPARRARPRQRAGANPRVRAPCGQARRLVARADAVMGSGMAQGGGMTGNDGPVPAAGHMAAKRSAFHAEFRRRAEPGAEARPSGRRTARLFPLSRWGDRSGQRSRDMAPAGLHSAEVCDPVPGRRSHGAPSDSSSRLPAPGHGPLPCFLPPSCRRGP